MTLYRACGYPWRPDIGIGCQLATECRANAHASANVSCICTCTTFSAVIGGINMPLDLVKRVQVPSWLAIPGACCPIGAGLIKIGHGSTTAALVVGSAPYVLCALVYCWFGVGFLFAAVRYLWTGEPQQDFISAWSCANVSVLTLTPPKSERFPAAHKNPRTRDGTRRTPPSQSRGTL